MQKKTVCRNCRKELSEDAKFCKYCGCSVDDNCKKWETRTSLFKKLMIIPTILLLVLLTVVCTVFFYLIKQKRNDQKLVEKSETTELINTETQKLADTEAILGLETAVMVNSLETESELIVSTSMETVSEEQKEPQTESRAETESEIVLLLSTISKTDYTSATTSPFTKYLYDASGNLLIEREYNEDGYIIGQTEHNYDENGNEVVRIGYNSDASIVYQYEFTYDNSGNQVIWTSVLMGTWHEYTYDESGNLLTDYDYGSKGSLLGWKEYTYDESGNVLTEKDYDINGEISFRCKYIYDSESLLLSYVAYDSDGTISVKYEYTYDEHGNQISDGRYSYEYTYDEQNNMISKTYVNKKRNQITVTYDTAGNVLTEMIYDSAGVLLSKCEYTYDDYGNELKKVEYDSDKNISALTENTYVTLEEAAEMLTASGSEEWIDFNEYYDYVLAKGGDYMLVAKQEETVTDVTEYVGVLDNNYNWIIPLSSDTSLTPNGTIKRFATGISSFEDRCSWAGYNIHYAGDDTFVIGESSGGYYGWGDNVQAYSGDNVELWNVATNTWLSVGEYTSAQSLSFTNGYYVAYSDDYILIVSASTGGTKTDIYCGSPQYVGRYSEGLFYSYNGFYDIEGNIVIDLEEYAGLIINQPYFSGGECTLEAQNSNGTVFTAVIDSEGNFISEFSAVESE